jgi:hypothetical protein
MNNAKEIKVKVKKVLMQQKEGQVDLIYLFIDAPSSLPSYPGESPFLVMMADEGYGAQWLQEVYGLSPDEVIEG